MNCSKCDGDFYTWEAKGDECFPITDHAGNIGDIVLCRDCFESFCEFMNNNEE